MATYQGYDSGDPKPDTTRFIWDQLNALRYASAQERAGNVSGFYDNVLKGILNRNDRLGRANITEDFYRQQAPNVLLTQGPTETIGAPGGAVSGPSVPGREAPARSYTPEERGSKVLSPGLNGGLVPVGSGTGSIAGTPQPVNMGPPSNVGAQPQTRPGPVDFSTGTGPVMPGSAPSAASSIPMQIGTPPLMEAIGFNTQPVGAGGEGAYDPGGGRRGILPNDPNYGLLFGYQPGGGGIGRPSSRGGY